MKNSVNKTCRVAVMAVAALALILGITQCRKPQVEPANLAGETISISFMTGNDEDAKTDVNLNNGKISWNSGDKVYVVYNGVLLSATPLIATPESDNKVASISGEITISASIGDNPSFTFYYVGNDVSFSPVANATNLSFSIANQSGTDAGEYMIGRTEPIVMIKTDGVYKPAVNPAVSRTFTQLTAVLWLDVSDFGDCTMTMGGAKTNNAMTINLSSPATPSYTTGSITFTGSGNAQISVLPTIPAASDATLSFSGNTRNGIMTVKNGIKSDRIYAKLIDDSANPIHVALKEVALPGHFSVSKTKQVRFSPGNLYYNGNWGFEANQYDFRTLYYENKPYPSCINGVYNENGTTSGNYGLFAFSTTYSTSNWGMNYSELRGDFKDWGLITTLPGNIGGNYWRTLTCGDDEGEWYYLTNERTGRYNGSSADAEHLRTHARIQVTGGYVNGLILLPDTFTLPSGLSLKPDASFSEYSGYNYTDNTYTLAQWVLLENAGAVFLPAAGFLKDEEMQNIHDDGFYRSSTKSGSSGDAYSMYFDCDGVIWDRDSKADGNSVRLVHDV